MTIAMVKSIIELFEMGYKEANEGVEKFLTSLYPSPEVLGR